MLPDAKEGNPTQKLKADDKWVSFMATEDITERLAEQLQRLLSSYWRETKSGVVAAESRAYHSCEWRCFWPASISWLDHHFLAMQYDITVV